MQALKNCKLPDCQPTAVEEKRGKRWVADGQRRVCGQQI